MNCPICTVQLKMAGRQGVEVNYCPDCRGVWIDCGGLDKIIDRPAAQASGPDNSEANREHHEDDRHHKSGSRRRKSFFSELFD